MERLCGTVQDMGNRMEGKIEHEGLERHQENQKFKEEMCDRMDEGFRKCQETGAELSNGNKRGDTADQAGERKYCVQ